ncbi:ribonuclease H-like domain-containing protein [Tanacetum coccineum]
MTRLVANASSQAIGVDFDELLIRFVLNQPPFVQSLVLSLSRSGLYTLRSLYGLKQAPRAWFQRFAGYASRAGFYHSRCDFSLFIYRKGSQVAYLLINVDDIILIASSSSLLQQIIDSLHNEFDMTDLGAHNYFLGISANCNSTGLFLSQRKYSLQLLERAHMVHCNPSRTPIDIESKLGQKAFLQGTVDISLYLYISDTTSLVGTLMLVGQLNVQHTLSRSSVEAEYRVVANVVAETTWLRNLLRELHSPLSIATLVYYDNVSAVYMSVNPVEHQRTKHIEIDIHFVRDMVTARQVRVLHVLSRYQYADIFTKGLPLALFDEFRSSLSVHPAPTAGAYYSAQGFDPYPLQGRRSFSTFGETGSSLLTSDMGMVVNVSTFLIHRERRYWDP